MKMTLEKEIARQRQKDRDTETERQKQKDRRMNHHTSEGF